MSRSPWFLVLLALGLSSACTSDLSDIFDPAPIVVDDGDAGDAGDDIGADDDISFDDDLPDDDVTPVEPEPMVDDDEPQPDPAPTGDDDVPVTPPEDAGSDGGEPTPIPVEAGAFQFTGSNPAHRSVDVDPEQNLVLQFNRDVQIGDEDGTIILAESLTGAFVEVVEITDEDKVTFDANTVTVDWATTLARSFSYGILVTPGAIEDESGEPFEGFRMVGELVFSTAAPEVLSLVDTNPLNGEDEIPLDADIVLTFSADVSAGQSGSLVVYERADDAFVASVLVSDTTVVTVAGNTVRVDLPMDLAYSTEYYVTLDVDAVQGMDGAPFGGFMDDTVLTFRTVEPPPLTLTSTTPMDDTVGVDPSTPLVFIFSEPVGTGSGSISVFEAESGTLVETVSITGLGVSISADTVTVDLSTTLESATEYTVTVDPGIVVSELGAEFAGISGTDLSFITADTPLEPLLLVDTIPENGTTNVDRDTLLSLIFSEPVRAGVGNISVFRDDGTLFEVISVTGSQVSIAADTVTIAPSGLLSGSATYYVLVTAGSFESLDGAVYAGLGDEDAFRFSTEAGFSLVSLSPTDDEAEVDPTTHLVLTFSEPAEAGSGSVAIYDASGDVLLEDIPIDDERVVFSGNTVTVDLDVLLDGPAAYYVMVDPGAIVESGGGESFEGTTMPTDWNFSTETVTRPGSVSAGLVLWLDADLAASVKTDSAVRYWADRSGQHNDVSNPSSGERPTRVSAAIGTRPAVRFDGTDDWLHADDGLELASAEGFIVWRSTLASSTSAKRSLLVNGENIEVNHSHPGGPEYSLAACTSEPCQGAAWSGLRFSPAPAANVTELWSFGYDATTTSLFSSVGGGSISFQPAPSTVAVSPTTALAIGGDEAGCDGDENGCHYDGDIGEVILYSRRLSQSERLAVVAYLRTKWSVPAISCASGEVLGDNGYCYFLSTSFIPWTNARDACVARGAGWTLATVRSQLDNDEVVGLLTGRVGDAWFGASDEVPNTWRWVNDTLQFWSGGSASSGGVPSNGAYTNWRSSEPSGGSQEGCGRYNLNNNVFSWSDASCTDSYPSVCQGPGQ